MDGRLKGTNGVKDSAAGLVMVRQAATSRRGYFEPSGEGKVQTKPRGKGE